MTLWYYGANGQQHGPVGEAELGALIAAGSLKPRTLVRRDGMADWQPVVVVPELGGRTIPSHPDPSRAAVLPVHEHLPVANHEAAVASTDPGIVGVLAGLSWGLGWHLSDNLRSPCAQADPREPRADERPGNGDHPTCAGLSGPLPLHCVSLLRRLQHCFLNRAQRSLA